MCNHQYTVYSTSIDPASLLVKCNRCKEKGRVLNFEKDEWYKAVDKEKFIVDQDRVENENDLFGFNFKAEF